MSYERNDESKGTRKQIESIMRTRQTAVGTIYCYQGLGYSVAGSELGTAEGKVGRRDRRWPDDMGITARIWSVNSRIVPS